MDPFPWPRLRPLTAGASPTVRWVQLSDGRPLTVASRGAAPVADGAVTAARALASGLGAEDYLALVDRWAPSLLRFHWEQCRNTQQAEDWLQETFLRAWRGRESLQDPGAARGWLFGIAAMLHREQYRRWRLERRHLGRPAELTDDIEADGMIETWDHQLLAALGLLAPEDRRLVLLVGAYGVSQRVVATALGLNESVVQKRWQRARKRLEAYLLDAEPVAFTDADRIGSPDKEAG